jgi:hypothetical protein
MEFIAGNKVANTKVYGGLHNNTNPGHRLEVTLEVFGYWYNSFQHHF